MSRVEETDLRGKVVRRWILSESDKCYIPFSATSEVNTGASNKLIHCVQCSTCGVFPILGTLFSCNSYAGCSVRVCTECYRAERHALSSTCSLTHRFFAFRYARAHEAVWMRGRLRVLGR